MGCSSLPNLISVPADDPLREEFRDEFKEAFISEEIGKDAGDDGRVFGVGLDPVEDDRAGLTSGNFKNWLGGNKVGNE